jgi:hypothetical protein
VNVIVPVAAPPPPPVPPDPPPPPPQAYISAEYKRASDIFIQPEAEYHSVFAVVVLYRIIPITGLAGRCAVVPEGKASAPVFAFINGPSVLPVKVDEPLEPPLKISAIFFSLNHSPHGTGRYCYGDARSHRNRTK